MVSLAQRQRDRFEATLLESQSQADIITTSSVTHIANYFDVIRNVASMDRPYWYRGVSNASYPLTPSALRFPFLSSSMSCTYELNLGL